MILGKHVSISGGIEKAPARAEEINCNALQIFVSNPRGWKSRSIDTREIADFKNAMAKAGMKALVAHATYLVNIASPKDDLRQKSIKSLKEDYRISGKLGADFLVFHPGSHTGSGLETGITKIAEAVNQILKEIDNKTLLLLENVAGAGTSIGSNFKQLHDIIKEIEYKNRVGICLDTCHAFAAGYDLRNRQGIDQMLTDIDEQLGLDFLKMLHINDSKYPFESKKDEHAHIGEGKIGKDGFESIINHPALKNIPFILETPQFEGKDKDVEILLELSN